MKFSFLVYSTYKQKFATFVFGFSVSFLRWNSTLSYLLLKIILFMLIFNFIFLHVQFFLWFLFYSIWTFAILIMYLFDLKILICSNSCFKFVKIIMYCTFECSKLRLNISHTMNSKLFLMNLTSLRLLFKFLIHYVTSKCMYL